MDYSAEGATPLCADRVPDRTTESLEPRIQSSSDKIDKQEAKEGIATADMPGYK
jgi:hypothetical protein